LGFLIFLLPFYHLISSFLNKKGLFALSFLATPQYKTKASGNARRATWRRAGKNVLFLNRLCFKKNYKTCRSLITPITAISHHYLASDII
jgi:hypothetical protein